MKSFEINCRNYGKSRHILDKCKHRKQLHITNKEPKGFMYLNSS